jgi:O-acetylhomoserine/O-acetylserine sulfhydrylase-like pyridoxal-dependent enzyme
MYIVGQEEIEALAAVIRKGALFRYGVGGECDRFERRYADFLGTRHVALTASGTFALTAAVTALGIGPGDEVLVPAHTYMATAMAVLAAGAIPVIVDVDESITIDPEAVENGIGPRTRAVIPVHMWGVACDMDRIMAIAAKHDLLVDHQAVDCLLCHGGPDWKSRAHRSGFGADVVARQRDIDRGAAPGRAAKVAREADALWSRRPQNAATNRRHACGDADAR